MMLLMEQGSRAAHRSLSLSHSINDLFPNNAILPS
jgi:hypothetical protein